MNRWQAIHAFWSSFGLTAYDQNTVPTGDNAPDFPYITYDASVGIFGTPQTLTASIWYRSPSWAEITDTTEQIWTALKVLPPVKCDGGFVWFRRGTFFAQRMSDPDDDMIRRMLLQIDVEFMNE